MEKTKHTLGNWDYTPEFGSEKQFCYYSIRVNGASIGTAHDNKHVSAFKMLPVTMEQAEANAKLMAAAPEMLDALKRINEMAQCSDDRFANYSDTINIITNEAIKKATT